MYIYIYIFIYLKYIYMYIYIFIYIPIHIYSHIHTHLYKNIHIGTCIICIFMMNIHIICIVWICIQKYTHKLTRRKHQNNQYATQCCYQENNARRLCVYIYTNTPAHKHSDTLIYTYIYTCIYIYIYTYMYEYIHT